MCADLAEVRSINIPDAKLHEISQAREIQVFHYCCAQKKKNGSVYIFLDNFLEAVMLTNCLHTQTGFRC